MSIAAITPISNSPTAPAGSFWSQLQPASYRGVPFVVKGGQARFGRRNALHEYPNRDVSWVEDLGRQARRYQITGFIVGDDVISQRNRLLAACEKRGDGELIHPTFGRLQVALMEVNTSESELGRVFEINFTFIEQGSRLFPSDATSSTTAIGNAVTAGQGTTSSYATTLLTAKLNSNVNIAIPAFAVASAMVANATAAIKNATTLLNTVADLPGNFGRLLGQASGIPFAGLVGLAGSLQGLVGAGAAARASVSIAGTLMLEGAETLAGPTLAAWSSLATAFTDTVAGATFTPADEIRALIAMQNLSTAGDPTSLLLGDLFRRAAVFSLGNASAAYQPSTSDEAASIRTLVLAAINSEMQIAGNQGDDSVYAALRVMRAQVILDMNAKGAQLPTLVEVKTPASVPSLFLAQKLYRDPTREPELTRRANPRHPAFMPLAFEALSS